MKKSIVIMISIVLLIPRQIESNHNKLLVFGGIGLCLTGLCGLYHLTKKSNNKFEPTSQSLNTLTFNPIRTSLDLPSAQTINIQKLVHHISSNSIPEKSLLRASGQKTIAVHRGISIDPDEQIIFLSSRGYAKRTTVLENNERELVKSGGCAIAAHILIQDNIVHQYPCITFDYPDDRSTFSFGQDTDYQCLTTMWNTIIKRYPNAKIIGIGDCRGARALLELATTESKNLEALVLLSPYISSRDLTEQVAKNHLGWLPGANGLLHTFFRVYFSSYNPTNDTLIHRLHQISPKLPIFIGHRKNDKLVSEGSMKHLLEMLKKSGHKDVYYFVIQDNTATHSRISHILELQYAINAFFAEYNLPHNTKLAKKGIPWLATAHKAAQEQNFNVLMKYS